MDLARAALACRLPWQVFECLISCTNRPKIINGPNVKRTRDPFEHVTAAQQGLFFVVCTGKEDSSGGGGEQQLPLGAGGTTAALCHVCGCPHSAAFHEGEFSFLLHCLLKVKFPMSVVPCAVASHENQCMQPVAMLQHLHYRTALYMRVQKVPLKLVRTSAFCLEPLVNHEFGGCRSITACRVGRHL
eukprot:scaffold18167_cov16-Tisochrysis_lutea.AAC.2